VLLGVLSCLALFSDIDLFCVGSWLWLPRLGTRVMVLRDMGMVGTLGGDVCSRVAKVVEDLLGFLNFTTVGYWLFWLVGFCDYRPSL